MRVMTRMRRVILVRERASIGMLCWDFEAPEVVYKLVEIIMLCRLNIMNTKAPPYASSYRNQCARGR